MSVNPSVPVSQERPTPRLWLVLVWSLATAIVALMASVPAYRWPWTSTLVLTARGAGLLVSEPISRFDTPYLSSAALRIPAGTAGPPHGDLLVVRASDDLHDIGELSGRTLLRVTAAEFAGTTWKPDRPVQFAPSSAVRLVFVSSAPPVPPSDLAITIGYDGHQPAVKSIRYWWPWILITYALGLVVCVSRWARIHAEQLGATTSRIASTHGPLIGLLAVAAVVRWALIGRGGQYFDWDEIRYKSGAEIFELLSTGNVRSAVNALLNTPDHPGYRLVAMAPAFLQVLSAWRTGHPVSETRWPSGEWLPASVLALASVGTLAMTYALAQRLGASRRESLLAAGLLAASTSMTVFSRHFFPYDSSLFLLLAALWIGLGNPPAMGRAYFIGLISGLSFLVYYGAWTLVIVIGVLFISQQAQRPRRLQALTLRAACFAAGVVTLPAILLGASTLAGMPLLTNALQFASDANNGDFAEGWSLPWNYLWSIEGALLLLYAGGLAAALVNVLRRRGDGALMRARVWLTGVALIYGWLVLGANVLDRFTVYDRLARQMLPFICLAAAAGFAARRAGSNRLFRNTDVGIAAIAAVLFIVNVSPYFMQRYPREFVWEAVDRYGIENIRLATTITNSVDVTVEAFLPNELRSAPDARTRRYAVVNAKDIWTAGEMPRIGPLPSGAVVLSTPHPRTLRSLRFHGYRPEQRRFFEISDLEMQVIDTGAAGEELK